MFPVDWDLLALMRKSIEGFRIQVFTELKKEVLLSGEGAQVDRLLTDVYGELDV